LGQHAAPSRGVLPPRMELRARSHAQHGGRSDLHPARDARCHDRRGGRRARALPRAAFHTAAGRSGYAGVRSPPRRIHASPRLMNDKSAAESTVDERNPWLGLASFTEETRSLFFGRDEEVAELARRVQRKLLTILFGKSGLGKTSILRAGLVPRLREHGYCPV